MGSKGLFYVNYPFTLTFGLCLVTATAFAQVSFQPQDSIGKKLYGLNGDFICTVKNMELTSGGKIEAYECAGGRFGDKSNRFDPRFIKIILGSHGIEKLQFTLPDGQIQAMVRQLNAVATKP